MFVASVIRTHLPFLHHLQSQLKGLWNWADKERKTLVRQVRVHSNRNCNAFPISCMYTVSTFYHAWLTLTFLRHVRVAAQAGVGLEIAIRNASQLQHPKSTSLWSKSISDSLYRYATSCSCTSAEGLARTLANSFPGICNRPSACEHTQCRIHTALDLPSLDIDTLPLSSCC